MLDEWLKRDKGDGEKKNWFSESKKGYYILVIAICVGLLALIWPITKVEKAQPFLESERVVSTDTSIKGSLTTELESILNKIEGAGKVNVSLVLDSDGVKTYATNTRDEKREIQESETAGIKKQTVEKNETKDVAVSSGSPLLLEEKYPKVLGVLVVAEGAKKPEVKEKLTNATVTLLDISAHRVSVTPRTGGV